MENLQLYYSPTCPYCLKVLRFMKEHEMQIELASTLEPENYQNLLAVGKKNQVPCLFIDGKALYESDDIIAYLAQSIDLK